jgi:hypothetical protein
LKGVDLNEDSVLIVILNEGRASECCWTLVRRKVSVVFILVQITKPLFNADLVS